VIPLKDDLPTERPPVVTVALIAVNAAAFLWQYLGPGLELSVQIGGLIPAELLRLEDLPPPDLLPPPLTVLTSMFLHGSFAHVGLNMLTLWIFGNNVEDALGRGRFLLFYLLCGLAAAAAQTASSALSGDLLLPMVGASGAIAGVLAAYMLLYPRQRVLTFIPPFWLVRIPAGFFIGGWFALQLLSVLLGGAAGGGVAFMAHVGGFLAGLALLGLWRPRRGSFERL
jgi:membrane associated rhomboid family serine protease